MPKLLTCMALIVPGSTLVVQPRSKAVFQPPRRKVTRDPQRRRGFISVGFHAAKPVSRGISFLDPPESLRLQISLDFSFFSDTTTRVEVGATLRVPELEDARIFELHFITQSARSTFVAWVLNRTTSHKQKSAFSDDQLRSPVFTLKPAAFFQYR